VTFCQRFGGAINLNPHFHELHIDETYTYDEGDDHPVFVPAPELKDEDVKTIVETTAHRVIGLLMRRGILDGDQLDPLAEESPILAGVTAASVQGMIATGERAGMRVRRVLSDPAEGVRTGPLCYASRGFSLHAATTVAAGDRDALERLCKYVARPPLAAGRLTQTSDDLLSSKAPGTPLISRRSHRRERLPRESLTFEHKIGHESARSTGIPIPGCVLRSQPPTSLAFSF
jgi:hypothetical protein